MGIPIPDNLKPVVTSTQPSLGELQAQTERNGKLTDEEYGFILESTLREKHRTDPLCLAYIDAFVRCKNNAQASTEVGIKASVGLALRNQKDVAVAIQKLIDRSAVKYGFDASELMERTKEMVDFDPIMVQNPDGSFKSNMHDIPAEARRNIKKMKVKNIFSEVEDVNRVKSKIIIGEIIEIEFYDKQKAIEMAGKEKELFKNVSKVEHTISDNMADVLLESAKRGAAASVEFNKKPVVIQGEVIDHG